MSTAFTALPIVDLAPLRAGDPPTAAARAALAAQLHDVFATVGFAYLVHAPLSFGEEAVFAVARQFFALPAPDKMKLAKRTFRPDHANTYRGYFPAQAGSDNLKEGFEMGPATPVPASTRSAHARSSPFVLTEPNVFPPAAQFPSRGAAEQLYGELQGLATTLLELLAHALGPAAEARIPALLQHSVSTLRLLHYPAPPAGAAQRQQELCCTPHTDSGLLTLLHQDATGGLEVRNAAGAWIPAPYVPGSLVVNIGDLMAQLSGGRFVATQHRVRSAGRDRYSVPFFCEPGVDALVGPPGQEMPYEQFVLGKMGTWVEFQDPVEDPPKPETGIEMSVEA